MASTYEYAGPPSDPRTGRFPRWPAWHAALAVFGGLAASVVLAAMVTGALRLKQGGPADTDVSTVLVDLSVVAATLLVAGMTERPRAWHFGLRRAPFKRALGIAVLGMLAFYLASVVYTKIVHPGGAQKTVQDVGANKGGAALVAGAIVIIGIAPICEEFFFRGFLYRILRMRMGLYAAAALDGVIFGGIHASGTPVVLLPVLAFLGFVFCLVYERTGTLFATIAMHSFNNMVSFSVKVHGGAGPATAVGVLLIAACSTVPLLLPRAARAPA